MKPIFADEVYAFFAMTALGTALGVLFDIFRAARRVSIKSDAAVHVSDALFWVVALFMSLRAFFVFNDGRLRACLFCAAFLGGVLYFLTVSRAVLWLFLKLFEIILKIFKIILKILLTPAHFLYKILLIGFKFVFGKIRLFFDKIKKKKHKKRGCLNGRKKKREQKNNNPRAGGFFGNRIFSCKRSNAAAKDNRKQRRNRKSEHADCAAAEKA